MRHHVSCLLLSLVLAGATVTGGLAQVLDPDGNLGVNSEEAVITAPMIEDVQISRGKWIDSWDWSTYQQKVLVRVEEPSPGSTACFVIEEPTGGRFVYSMCAGGFWPDWYGSFPTNWDMWVVRHDDTSLTFGFWQRSMLDKPPASSFYIEVNDFTVEGTSLTTPDAPEIPEEALVLLAPERDSVIETPVPTFEWLNWTAGVDNWLQLKAEGSTYSTGTWDPDDHGEIWRAYVADQTSAVYNFYGSPPGPDLDPGRSYFWRLSSSRVEDDYTRDPCVRFTTTQIGQHRFTLDAEWPPLPELPGKLAHAAMMWGDWSGLDVDSEAIRLYGTTVEERSWLSSDYFARPNWSWDGSELLYYRKDQGLWIDPLDGSMPWHIPVDAWGQQSWSPDNTRVVYGWVHLTPYWELWTTNADGSDVQPLVINYENNLKNAAWSPDGLWIAYNSCCDASGYNVWLSRPDGSETRPAIPAGLAGYADWVITWMAEAPSWSPDAKQLGVSFAAESPDGAEYREGIGVISRDGGEITPVFFNPPGVVCCASARIVEWSPDGESVLFKSAHHVSPDPEWPEGKFETGVELFMIAADGSGEPLRLTYDYSMNMEANWWAPNTEVGHDVAIIKGDATVTFNHVVESGSTRMTVTDQTPGPAPEGLAFVGDCWEEATTAQTRGTVRIAIRYEQSLLPPKSENTLRLLQWVDDRWVDITVPPIDKEHNIIRGECKKGLSIFGVGVRSPYKDTP